jgi:integrase
MRKTMTDKGVAALKPRSSPYPDPQMVNHYIRVRESGSKSFVCQARDPYGKQKWHTTGSCDVLRIEESRDLARAAIKRIKQGLPPEEPPPVKPDSFRSVAENWFMRHVIAKKFRTEDEIKRCLERYVYPEWADRDFISIRRSDITSLLDHIEDHHGSRMADIVLGKVRNIASWFAGRNDNYISPFTGNLRRHTDPARSRILDDGELKTIWEAAEGNSKLGAFVQLLLLVGQRSEKVRTMKWEDIVDGTWIIATAEREKTNAGSLALPPLALQIIEAQPRIGKNPYVFTGRGDNPMDISKIKYLFNEKLPSMPRWTLHDCRRTNRSLLSRCGISYEIGERILGHTVGSAVSQIYDRHKYDLEKKIALEKLASLIDGIVHPRDNVLPMQKKRKRES